MKFSTVYFYIFVFTIFSTGQVFSQSDTVFSGISFIQKTIGKPLSSIKDSLFDGNRNYVRNPQYKKNAVTIFSCSPSDKNILYINNIQFQELGFVIDTTGIINGIHFLKGYFGKRVAHDKKLFNTEYKSIIAYLEANLQLQGIAQPYIDEKTFTQERIVWETKSLKYTLINQQSKKIKNIRPMYDIVLEVFRTQ